MPDKTYSLIPGPGGKQIKGEDLKYDIEEERENRYKLKDGTTLKVKLVVGKISRGLNDDGTMVLTPDGEPLYSIRFRTVITAEVPPELLREGSNT